MRIKNLALVFVPATAAILLAATPLSATAETYQALPDGYQVVPTLSTTGMADFRVKVDRTAKTIQYRLSYQGLEGNVTQAHIHLGRPGTNGGIFLFLCTNLSNDPAGTAPACPGTTSGSVSRTALATDIVTITAQGLAAGDFDAAAKAIDAGAAYAMVHSSLYPPGEVRGVIMGMKHHHDHGDD